MELHSKNRFNKVDITDVAIKKVQRINYKGLTKEQNNVMHNMARLVLIRSMTENDSNEVAYTIDIDDLDGKRGFAKGDEHGVNIGLDTDSHHIVRTGNTVVIIHNHPSTQTLSIEDIALFLHYDSVIYIVVVSNQGTVHYLMKDKDYDFYAAERLRAECCMGLNCDTKDFYNAALDFLTHCSEVGLYYS